MSIVRPGCVNYGWCRREVLRRCVSLLALVFAFHPGITPAAEPASIVLVARPMVTDANFARTVLLVTRTPRNEVIGVILNRRMRDGDVPASLPDDAVLRDKVRELYFGGPLTPRGLFAAGPSPAVSNALDAALISWAS